MNKLIGEIAEIKSLERLNLIKFNIGSQIVNVLMLEMNIDLNAGKRAELLIKPTAISLSQKPCVFENSLSGKIIEINKGEILSSIIVEVSGFELECITLSEYVDFKDEVYVFFKASDVAIGKVLE